MAQGYERVTLNATVLCLTLTRRNKLFNINLFALVAKQSAALNFALNKQCLINSVESGEGSTLTKSKFKYELEVDC